jgi:hypothetical protein
MPPVTAAVMKLAAAEKHIDLCSLLAARASGLAGVFQDQLPELYLFESKQPPNLSTLHLAGHDCKEVPKAVNIPLANKYFHLILFETTRRGSRDRLNVTLRPSGPDVQGRETEIDRENREPEQPIEIDQLLRLRFIAIRAGGRMRPTAAVRAGGLL